MLSALAASSALAADPKTVTLDVPGMSCSLCQISVRKALERVPGVIESKAINEAKCAEVKYERAGFPATVRTP